MDDQDMGLETVPRSKVPKDVEVISTIWAIKKKSNVTFRARVDARGFMQIEGSITWSIVFPHLSLMKPPFRWYLFS